MVTDNGLANSSFSKVKFYCFRDDTIWIYSRLEIVRHNIKMLTSSSEGNCRQLTTSIDSPAGKKGHKISKESKDFWPFFRRPPFSCFDSFLPSFSEEWNILSRNLSQVWEQLEMFGCAVIRDSLLQNLPYSLLDLVPCPMLCFLSTVGTSL